MKYAWYFYNCKYTNYKAVDPILESCKSGPSIHKARWTRTVSQMINDSPHPAQLVISLELSPLKYFRDYPPSCTSSAGKLQLCKVLSVGKKLYLIQDADWQTDGWTEKWTESFLNPPKYFVCRGYKHRTVWQVVSNTQATSSFMCLLYHGTYIMWSQWHR